LIPDVVKLTAQRSPHIEAPILPQIIPAFILLFPVRFLRSYGVDWLPLGLEKPGQPEMINEDMQLFTCAFFFFLNCTSETTRVFRGKTTQSVYQTPVHPTGALSE
jgi:hypothetical protein